MDNSLIKKCLQGHAKAQRQLYEKYAPKMYAVCFRYVADSFAAQEVLQEGFIKVFQKLGSFNEEGSFEGWMRKVFINTALGYLRKHKRKYSELSIEGRQAQLASTTQPSIVNEMATADIMSAIAQLSTNYRDVVNLFIVDGYSHKEIATLLSISVDTSKQRLKRGRKQLQDMLKTMHHLPNESISRK